ncbi:MFS transporter [Micromonospora costi]|uniref:MFS transporter n=1 Tax=Micromonospora costi TaxID=1530042 RepID=A0A3A9ZPF2_9ACTN|nr:MFS transporter [Micromonospora costi]RKN49834.1 MFS transporter [Micromonospora costi]
MNVPGRAVVLIVVMNLAYLPVAMRQLLVVLLGHHNTGSFTTAGMAGAACGIGLALTAPMAGRLLGRLGDRPVLLATGVGHLGALLGLAVVTDPAGFVALAAAAGLSSPPVLAAGRARLATLVPAPELGRAYAVNAVGQEVLYVGGPLAVTLSLAVTGPAGALLGFAAVGSVALVATAVVSTGGPGRGWTGTATTSLAGRATLRTLIGTHVAYTTCMGAMWVLVPAFAAAVGRPGQAGLLVAVWSAGSLAGGLLLARRGRPGTPGRAYLGFLAALTVTSFALPLPRSVPQMAVALAVFGLGLAPWLAVTDEILALTTPAPRLAEAYGWLLTAGQLGISLGAATSGAVNDRFGNAAAFLVVGAALTLALGTAGLRRRTLRAPAPAATSRAAHPVAPG